MRVFDVRLFRAILVTATLAFWLAGSNHCRLEQLPGLEFLACAPADCTPGDNCESSDCGGHEDSGCADDACADDSCSIVEGAVYQAGTLRVKTDAPASVAASPSLPSLLFPTIVPSPASRLSSADSESPPEIPRLWHFAQRAAAPPRAPSLHS